MATINDKLEQQEAQTQELTEKELDQATGGTGNNGYTGHAFQKQEH